MSTTTKPSTTTDEQTTQSIASALLSVARVMTQVRVHEMLCRRAGVSLDRSGAALLYKLHTDGEGARITELAERLGVDSPAVTRKVQQLERAGLLRRESDPADARACRLTLTGDGRHSIEDLLRTRERWLAELLTDWSVEDRRELARLLEQFAATIVHNGEPDRD